jgi:hypothetical protein
MATDDKKTRKRAATPGTRKPRAKPAFGVPAAATSSSGWAYRSDDAPAAPQQAAASPAKRAKSRPKAAATAAASAPAASTGKNVLESTLDAVAMPIAFAMMAVLGPVRLALRSRSKS